MTNLEETDMYDWRVRALMNWIQRNKEPNGSLSMNSLCKAGHLDQYHYLGTLANDEVIRILGLDETMSVLDVGCGIGGPPRYLTWKSGARVTGIDIQPQLVDAGNQVSELVGLSDKVCLVSGDVTSLSDRFEKESFDAFISLLVILHIENRQSLFSSLFLALKAGGGFLIEDMVHVGETPFTAAELGIARDVVGSPYLPNICEYANHLREAGFVDVEFEILTPSWVQWCIDRSDQYNASKEEQIRLNGEKVFNQRSSFYAHVKTLFLSGKLGGVRITGRKPNKIEQSIANHRKTHSRNLEQLGSVSIIE